MVTGPPGFGNIDLRLAGMRDFLAGTRADVSGTWLCSPSARGCGGAAPHSSSLLRSRVCSLSIDVIHSESTLYSGRSSRDGSEETRSSRARSAKVRPAGGAPTDLRPVRGRSWVGMATTRSSPWRAPAWYK